MRVYAGEMGRKSGETGIYEPMFAPKVVQSVRATGANLQSRHGVPLMRGFKS